MDMESEWLESSRDETLHEPEPGYTRYAYDRDGGVLWAAREIKGENDSYEHELEVTFVQVNELEEGPRIYLEYVETYFQGEDGGSCTAISEGDGRGSGDSGSGSGTDSGSGSTGSWTACGDGDIVKGIDISYWQPNIAWNTVADSGMDFAFIRTSDGFYEDPDYATNWAGAQAAGIIRGTYQYFRPGTDASAQADLLLRRMGSLEADDLPPVLDVETSDGYSQSHLADGIWEWADVIESEVGRKPIIYTSPGLWSSLVASDDFGEYPLWVAHWGVDCPSIPNGWDHWVFWQTSATGSVGGISGNVDTDVFNGDYTSLVNWANGG